MGLVDRFRGEFIDIISWLDDSRDTMVWRYPRHDNEIKMGAQLVVRESQTAVFVNEGQIADVFTAGTHTLTTQNLPLLSTLKGWKYGFDSPFKAEVYFVNTRQFTDLKWGTQNPVIVRDAELGAVRLRAFGSYAIRVTDGARLLRELVGTDPQFRTEEVGDYLRQMIVSRLGPALATSGVPLLDLAAAAGTIGAQVAGILSEDLANLGLSVPMFLIENISVPPEVEAALDKRSQLGILGSDLDRYTRLQTANAIEDAAQNPGSGAGGGIGLGMGLAVGQQLAQHLNPPVVTSAPPPSAVPPPLPGAWYTGFAGQQQGPFDRAGLAAAAHAGSLTATTLVWRSGMSAWAPAAEIPEVAALLAAVPPPLPGS